LFERIEFFGKKKFRREKTFLIFKKKKFRREKLLIFKKKKLRKN